MIVQLSARARREFDAALGFLAKDAPQAAEVLGACIDDAIRSLREMPNRGRAGTIPGTRELPVRRAPYVIVYSVGAEEVLVLRIRHTSQDPSP